MIHRKASDMTRGNLSAGPAFCLVSMLLAIVLAIVPSASAPGQTYGAQQAVRGSVDNLGGAGREADQGTSAVAGAAVSYQRDVRPILQASCNGCHRAARSGGGLEMTAFANLLQGGESGVPAIVPGNPDESYLIQQITPVDGEAAMPKGRRPLAASQIALIRRWIEEGAVDDSTPGTGYSREGGDAYRYDRSMSSGSSAGMIDTTYVSSTAIVVASFRPAQLMTAPIAEMLPTEVFTAAGLQYLGFDPAGVEEVTAFAGQINVMAPPEFGVVFKFNAPFRAATINRAIRAHAKLSELAGKRYLQSQHPMMPSFFGPDNRTLVVAPDATLRRLVESQGQPKTGPMIERVSAAQAGSDLYLAIDVASLRPYMEMGIAQAKASGRIPPQGEKFLELPKLISAAELTLNLTAAGPMSLVVHAKDDADAQQLETLLAEATTNPAAATTEQYTAGRYATEDPVSQAVTQFVERFSQPFRPQRNGTSVTLFRVEAQSQTHQQLSSLAVFGIGAGLQAFQASRTAAASNAETGLVEPTESTETIESTELPSR
jgi:hypothetical protein